MSSHKHSSCCHVPAGENPAPGDVHEHQGADKLFWGSFGVIAVSWLLHYLVFAHDHETAAGRFTGAVYELMNTMLPGIVIGIVMMGLLARVPRGFIMALLGARAGRVQGILRATVAGVLFDVCSHAIMMIAAKLYERGASLGQVMAFLIASPWNSVSLTVVLVSLIGLKWTLVFTALSVVIAIISGLLFEWLVDKKILPSNPHGAEVQDKDFSFWAEAKAGLKRVKWTPAFVGGAMKQGLMESGMLLRWLFIGVIITGFLRVVVTPDSMFADMFGPSLMGLGVTFVIATIIEVCSEGATPIAADIFRRAGAVGNSFTFLMAGVSTNYTTIMVLREATKSWKTAFFLPLVTVPQVLVLGYILNQFGP